MNEPDEHDEPFCRSPELMSAGDTALVVVDVQEKLIDLISGHVRVVWNIRRLLDGAKLLQVRVAVTEQYPQGLGRTVPELAERLRPAPAKMTFSCASLDEIWNKLQAEGVFRLLVCGIESHVCIQQSVLDLLALGFRVYVSVDAVGARGTLDHEIALRRMESAGATLTTTEAALFEWCQTAARPEFKAISGLVKEKPPAF